MKCGAKTKIVVKMTRFVVKTTNFRAKTKCWAKQDNVE